MFPRTLCTSEAVLSRTAGRTGDGEKRLADLAVAGQYTAKTKLIQRSADEVVLSTGSFATRPDGLADPGDRVVIDGATFEIVEIVKTRLPNGRIIAESWVLS